MPPVPAFGRATLSFSVWAFGRVVPRAEHIVVADVIGPERTRWSAAILVLSRPVAAGRLI